MKTGDLIKLLGDVDPSLEVMFAYDGSLRGSADVVWITQGNEAMKPVLAIGTRGEPIYNSQDRPAGAPAGWTVGARVNP